MDEWWHVGGPLLSMSIRWISNLWGFGGESGGSCLEGSRMSGLLGNFISLEVISDLLLECFGVGFSGSSIGFDLFLTGLKGSLGCEFFLLLLNLSSSDLGSKLVLLCLFIGKFLGRLLVLGLIDNLLEGDGLIGFGGFLNLSSLGFLLFSNNFSGGLN